MTVTLPSTMTAWRKHKGNPTPVRPSTPNPNTLVKLRLPPRSWNKSLSPMHRHPVS